MLPEAAGRGQHFQDLGHSFTRYGPPSRQITYICFGRLAGNYSEISALLIINISELVEYILLRHRNTSKITCYAPSNNEAEKDF